MRMEIMSSPSRVRRGGRPGKGDRLVVLTRLPRAEAELLFALAEVAGASRSDFVGGVLLRYLAGLRDALGVDRDGGVTTNRDADPAERTGSSAEDPA